MPGLDNMEPAMDQQPEGEVIGTHGGTDREGAMAKADLFKLANYSHKLYQQMNDEDQLEAWVQAKITKAADYIASVYHYLEYEMKFSEYGHHLDNSDTLSEGQKMKIKELLSEAKDKMKDLKKSQAEKMKDKKKVDENRLEPHDESCEVCGGSGVKSVPGRTAHPAKAGQIEKYSKFRKAIKAIAGDKNGDGVVDEKDKEIDEDFESLKKTGDSTKTHKGNVVTKTDKGIEHTRPASTYSDGGDDIASNAKSGKGVKSHAKGETAAEKKAKAPAQKQSPKSAKTWGMKDSEKFDNRDGAPAKPKKEKEVDETYGKGVYEAKKAKKDYDGDGKVESGKDEYLGSRIAAAKKAGKLKEGQKCNHTAKGKSCPVHGLKECSGMYEEKHDSGSDPLANREKYAARHGQGQVYKPTHPGNKTGMTKAHAYDINRAGPKGTLPKESTGEKSAVVKKAKAGGDIGKPGKSFDKVAKSAGGGEKGKKIAAAAMWKNIKETTAYIAEKSKAVKPDFLDMDKDGDKKEPMKKAVGDKKKETVKESTDFTRMQELSGRLNRTEKPALVENREVDQIRALTKRLLG